MVATEQKRMSITDALDTEDLSVSKILAYTGTNAYHSVYEGFQEFELIEKDGKLLIAPKGDLKSPVVIIEDDKVFIHSKGKDAYKEPVWTSNELMTEDKLKEALKAFNVYAQQVYSYGGAYPYIEILREVFVEPQEPKPIGEAEIGRNFIVS